MHVTHSKIELMAPELKLDRLGHEIAQLADMFSRWSESNSSHIPERNWKVLYRQLEGELAAQARSFKGAVLAGEKEAAAGATVAHTTAYLLDQLLQTPAPPISEIKELIEDLRDSVGRLIFAATALKASFQLVQQGLTKISTTTVPRLMAKVQRDCDRARVRANEALAARGTLKAVGGAAIGLGVASLVFPPLMAEFGVAAVTLGGSSVFTGGVMAEVAAADRGNDAKEFEKQEQEAIDALETLHDLEDALNNAITIVGEHVEYWSALQETLISIEPDPTRLIDKSDLPKIGVVKMFKHEWLGVEKMYKAYGAQTRLVGNALALTAEGE